MLEWFAPGFVYNAGKDLIRLIWPKKLTSEQVIERRQKWKPLFEAQIVKNWCDNLRQDAIIRDMRRVDKYPDIDEDANGISPWFRLGLIDIYHRGILVAFTWERLIEEPGGGFRAKQHGVDEEEGIKVILAGKIPFENIESVDFDGDEFYNYPHIYCHFCIKGQPYESIDYYEERQSPNARPYYAHVISQDEVIARSPHLRKPTFWHRLRIGRWKD